MRPLLLRTYCRTLNQGFKAVKTLYTLVKCHLTHTYFYKSISLIPQSVILFFKRLNNIFFTFNYLHSNLKIYIQNLFIKINNFVVCLVSCYLSLIRSPSLDHCSWEQPCTFMYVPLAVFRHRKAEGIHGQQSCTERNVKGYTSDLQSYTVITNLFQPLRPH